MSLKFHQQKTVTNRQRNKYSHKKLILAKATEMRDKSHFVSKKTMLEEIFRA